MRNMDGHAILPVVKLKADATGIVGDTVQLGVETVKAKPNTAVVMKYEEDTENPLAGSEITLYNAQKESLGTVTTNEKGKVDFANVTDLVPGTYYYKETKAPSGYKVNNTEYSFVVDSQGNVQFSEAALQGEVVKTEVPEGYIGIYTPQDLDNIRNKLDGKYILMNDIDMSSITSFTPIGNEGTPFKGILDGNYQKIRSLKINSSEGNVGLFGYIKDGTIKNIELNNISAKSTYKLQTTNGNMGTIGCLAGRSDNEKIKNVKVTGNSKIEVGSNNNFGGVGGLIGVSYNNVIERCSTIINIDTSEAWVQYIGGIIGSATTNKKMFRCYSKMQLRTRVCYRIGGLIGGASSGEIKQCYSDGNINFLGASNYYDNSKACCIGGISANIGGTDCESFNLLDSYSNLSVSGNEYSNIYIGAIVVDDSYGRSQSYDSMLNITNTYSSGRINISQRENLGGIVGWSPSDHVNITSSYLAPELSGPNATNTGSSRTVEQMKTQANYENWDFEDIWGIDEGTSYPYFLYQRRGVIYNEKGTEEEKLYLSTSVYTLNNTYMSRIKPKTTVDQLIANCQTNGTIEIFDQKGKKLNGTDYVGTGMRLVDTKLDEKIEVKLSVIGDLNGDGKVSLVDIARSELGYIGNMELKDEFLMAADIDGNGKHTITDIARLEQYLVGLIEI